MHHGVYFSYGLVWVRRCGGESLTVSSRFSLAVRTSGPVEELLATAAVASIATPLHYFFKSLDGTEGNSKRSDEMGEHEENSEGRDLVHRGEWEQLK